jgi:hypothetical protein
MNIYAARVTNENNAKKGVLPDEIKTYEDMLKAGRFAKVEVYVTDNHYNFISENFDTLLAYWKEFGNATGGTVSFKHGDELLYVTYDRFNESLKLYYKSPITDNELVEVP